MKHYSTYQTCTNSVQWNSICSSYHQHYHYQSSSILPLMALNGLYCADVSLSNYSLTTITNNTFVFYYWTFFDKVLQENICDSRINANCLQLFRTKLKFTNRTFSHTAPTIWNGLAVCRSALSTVTLSQFKHLVKSELYNRAFDNIWNVTFPHLWFFYWMTLSASTTV